MVEHYRQKVRHHLGGRTKAMVVTMYVDKRLDGVQAVQTLSRLNRKIPGREIPFVLDFVNEAEDIYRAFKPYYDATGCRKLPTPHHLRGLNTHSMLHKSISGARWRRSPTFSTGCRKSRMLPTTRTCNDTYNPPWIASKSRRT